VHGVYPQVVVEEEEEVAVVAAAAAVLLLLLLLAPLAQEVTYSVTGSLTLEA
jgi:hypothetical protein